jgi:lipopolysaccharide export system protein LptA
VITPLRLTATRVALFAASISVVIAVAGCTPSTPSTSGSSPAAGTGNTLVPASSDSCSVVKQSDVSSALGETVQPGVRGKATVEGGVACVFYGPEAPAGANPDVPVPDSVRVVLVTGANGTKWFNDYKTKVPAIVISGLGDQAYYDGSASVSVLKGSSYLRISVIKTTGTDEAAEKALAATALPNM